MFHPEDYETLFGQNNSLYPSIEPSFLLAERIVVGIVCILSILGGLSVVFSFLCNSETACKCKEVYYHLCCGYKIQERDPDDETQIISKYPLKSYNCILVHLSIADIIVAGSHFWGLVMHLEERFAPNDTESRMMNNQSAIPAGFDISCTTQAAFTALSTFASFFWTDILAVFLAFNLIFEECSNNKLTGLNKTTAPEQIEVLDDDTAPNCCESPFFLHILFPLIGWGVPVVMVVAFAASNVLGYTESYDGGWCFVYLDPNTMSLEQRHNLINYGYRFWLYGSVIIVLLCTISYSVYGCYKKIKDDYKLGCTECRYLWVGIAFTLLRIPSTIVNAYLISNPLNYRTTTAAVISIIASATISMQGWVNGIIYLCCRSRAKGNCCLSCGKDGYELARAS